VTEHAPTVVRPDFIGVTAAPILDWWGTKTLADIRGKTCRDYVEWRVAQGVRNQTVRHDLKTLRAALNLLSQGVRSAAGGAGHHPARQGGAA
jgi:hypothetical protein